MKEHIKYAEILHSLFEDNFMGVYKKTEKKKQKRLLPYMQALYRRWYYATLVEYTPFSPANLMESINAYYKIPADTYPLINSRMESNSPSISIKFLPYTTENHPIASDMQTILDYCTPHIDLTEEMGITDKQSLKFAEKLSINDPHYASFLLELAVWMKFLKKMPSLHVQRMQISKKCEAFLSSTPEEMLQDIFDATISLSAYGLRNSTPLPEHIFTESFLHSLLTKPLETDDIFARVFDVIGYNIEDLMGFDDMPEPDAMSLDSFGMDMEVLSSVFILGLVLDKFFFTPFGQFLRVIRPMYALPFSFEEEVRDYFNVCDDPEEAFVAFYAPCSSYTLTDLGLKLLELKPTKENYFNAAELPFDTMKDTVFSEKHAISLFVKMAQQLTPLAENMGMLPAVVYTFRVRLQSDKSMWLDLQVPDSFSLDNLYVEIADIFDIKCNSDFSFFHDKVENRFAEYPSQKRAVKSKKNSASDCSLADLDFEHMKYMLLVARGQSSIFDEDSPVARFSLELLKTQEPEFTMYPQISRVSKKMRLKMEAEEGMKDY